jgi:16S rRNA (cytosine967-C5)-methyltransferase
MSKTSNSARAVAVRVLERVAAQGAFASRALDAELSRARLEDRDAALATEIVYGTLRVLPDLDARIAPHLRRDPEGMDSLLRAALRAGCYQLMHLSRVPEHAVVNETVGIVRAARGAGLAGLANAVLRKLALARPSEPTQPHSIALPRWVETEFGCALHAGRRAAWLDQAASAPPVSLRVRIGEDRGSVADALRAARPGALVRESRVSPLALLLSRAGDPRSLPGYAEGRFCVQDEGAQIVALCLGARAGEAVADLCAGHGGKTTLLCEAVGSTGEVLAVDLDQRKLDRIGPELERLGLSAARVQRRAIDLAVGPGGLEARFDRVLVDAPCTGLGTIGRRPELLLRLGADDPARMAELQFLIARQAVRLLRPGGVLVYAVCSPTRAEGPEVAARLEAAVPGLERLGETPLAGLHTLATDDDGVLRLGPWLAGEGGDSPDVYQVVTWRLAKV